MNPYLCGFKDLPDQKCVSLSLSGKYGGEEFGAITGSDRHPHRGAGTEAGRDAGDADGGSAIVHSLAGGVGASFQHARLGGRRKKGKMTPREHPGILPLHKEGPDFVCTVASRMHSSTRVFERIGKIGGQT